MYHVSVPSPVYSSALTALSFGIILFLAIRRSRIPDVYRGLLMWSVLWSGMADIEHSIVAAKHSVNYGHQRTSVVFGCDFPSYIHHSLQVMLLTAKAGSFINLMLYLYWEVCSRHSPYFVHIYRQRDVYIGNNVLVTLISFVAGLFLFYSGTGGASGASAVSGTTAAIKICSTGFLDNKILCMKITEAAASSATSSALSPIAFCAEALLIFIAIFYVYVACACFITIQTALVPPGTPLGRLRGVKTGMLLDLLLIMVAVDYGVMFFALAVKFVMENYNCIDVLLALSNFVLSLHGTIGTLPILLYVRNNRFKPDVLPRHHRAPRRAPSQQRLLDGIHEEHPVQEDLQDAGEENAAGPEV